MIVDQLYNKKNTTNESLADEFMAMARAKGYNPRLRGTPDEERARTDAMLKQRAADRAAAPAPAPVSAEERAGLEAKLKQLQAQFDPNYEYSDDHSFWTQQRGIAQQIGAIKQKLSQGVAEGLNEMDKSQKGAPGWNISDDEPGGKESYGKAAKAKDVVKKASKSLDKAFDKAHSKKKVKESRLNEAMLMEDPVYRKFKNVGRYIVEYKMSEKQILDVFAQAEAGMTDKATGANRTFLGRGKDTAMDFAGGVKDAVSSVMNSIQNSVPVAAVDVAYDQATDALANVAGGQKGAVMQAIKKYRNLVKQYPKAAGFAKAALVAIAGLATGGAGLPAIAGLTYALDSAIKGDKLSSIIGKGAGAAVLAYGAGQLADYFKNPDAVIPADTPVKLPDGTNYIVKPGDTLSQIAKDNGLSVADIMKANGPTSTTTDLTTQGWNNPYHDTFSNLDPMGNFTGPSAHEYATTTTPANITNPDVLKVGQNINLPASTGATNPYAGGVGTAGDTWNKIGSGQYPFSQISANQAAKYGLKEAVKFKKLSFDKMVDDKATVMDWALSESIGVKRQSVTLSNLGTLTVFENVDRCRKAIMELKGVPGSTRPDQYRPDMPGGAGKASKPGLIGRGLNWLDKQAGKVGGALSNVGHQFTTGVTKEKLKMNWHQAGKPSDSDQLAAWLVKQGVPQDVVGTVYGQMGIPYTAQGAAAPSATEPDQAAANGGAQKSMPFYGTNPATGKAWTQDELQAKANAVPGAKAPAPAPTPGATTGKVNKPANMTSVASNPAGFNASNIFKQPGMEKYAKKPAPAAAPNFGANAGYAKVNQPTSISFSGMPGMKPAAAPAPAPAGPKVVSGGPTPDEQAKLAQRIAQATKQPVAEMLSMVETKEDVQRIKKFIDQTFTKYGAVSESAFVIRNKLIEHVIQVGAQRRREFARKS